MRYRRDFIAEENRSVLDIGRSPFFLPEIFAARDAEWTGGVNWISAWMFKFGL